MPNATSATQVSLLERVRRVLGRLADVPFDEVIDRLVSSGEADLAREVAQQLTHPTVRVALPGFMAPVAERVPQDPYGPPRFQPFYGYNVATEMPTHRQATRPAAKEPTSTTAIGAAEPIDAAYAALVAELGINSGAVDLEQFKALVPQLGLRIYDRAEVTEYLHCQYKVPPSDLTHEVAWGWRPLRPIDRGVGRATVPFNGSLQRGVESYIKPIPYPVLLTVKAVVDACPSARFYVSDEMQGEKIPDPFLLVEIAGEQFVIERWDEPAFRGKA